MLIEAARRAEAAAKEMLALVNHAAASCAEAREVLEVCRSTAAVVAATQTSAAKLVAGVEGHGDGGAQVLADAAGLTRRDACGQVKTAAVIEAAPALRDAVESGRVSSPNARRLAETIEKTSADAVESDGELLAKAASMRPEQFTKEARRWAADRQRDGGEADYRRLRAKRQVRIWDADDGTVELHGKLDPVAGRRIANRLQAEARRLYDTDKKQPAERSRFERRSLDQCMADALDNLTANAASSNGKPFADICVVAHLDEASGKLVAETPDGQRLPQAVLEELACNAKFTGVLYDRDGRPIWRAHSVRTATEAQRQILLARYGGCFHCGAHPAVCQIHHIKPVSQGGSTKIRNMVPICWDCHQKIHHHNWQIHTTGDGHTLHPPNRIHYGPARAPDVPILHLPGTEPDLDPVPPRPPVSTRAVPEVSTVRQPGASEAAKPPPTRPDKTRAGPGAPTLRQPGAAQAAKPPATRPDKTRAGPGVPTSRQPGAAQAAKPPPTRPDKTRATLERPELPTPSPAQAPDPPPPRAQRAPSGPAAARAALRNARAWRSETMAVREA